MGSERKRIHTSTTPSHSVQSAHSVAVDFLNLPEVARNKVYSNVLLIPHPLYIFQDNGSKLESFAPDKPTRWLAILYTNRQISHEASAALYAVNCFHLVDITQQQFVLLHDFLNCIGSAHAAVLSHLCINFPVVEGVDGQRGKAKIRDDSLESLKLLRERCTGLSTLETLVHNKNCSLFKEDDDFIRGVLPEIDAQFRTIPSLKKIMVRIEVFDGVPSTSARDLMQELGWVVLLA
ncbi:hypothetical protein EJ08DRAFT_99122 [Tothia fuscella]|uniref:Uncharacterized protein n=1 Tax=Tothia fuscella TaxID=1048955 RepID=A0A9P4NE88_9PEZI|nr:hypothetical protein EJ08DRAFT_99122 [Tothia fuscella]